MPDLGTTDGVIPIGDVAGMEDGVGTVVRDGAIVGAMAADLGAEISTEATSFMVMPASTAVADITQEVAFTAAVDSTAAGVGNASACISGKTAGSVICRPFSFASFSGWPAVPASLFLARMTSRKTAAVVE